MTNTEKMILGQPEKENNLNILFLLVFRGVWAYPPPTTSSLERLYERGEDFWTVSSKIQQQYTMDVGLFYLDIFC